MSSTVAAPAATLAQAAAGYRTTLLSHAVRLLCKVAGVVVLARLVSPAEHGHFAMAASVVFFLTLFRDFGFGTAAIQARELSAGHQAALWRMHVGLGVALALVTLVLAPAAAAFFMEARVTALLAVMSISFVFIGGNGWPRTLLNRELRFAELNRVETTGAVLGTLAMIGSGFAGAGAYAFVAFLLVSEATMLVEAWRFCAWRPGARPDWRGLRELAGTGLHLTGYNVLLYGLQQTDTLLMGRWFGAGPLGLYNRAGQLLIQPATHLAAPFSQVLLATLARLGPASPAFAAHLRDTANVIAHFTLPIAVACMVLPDEIVRLVLGGNWPGAAPLLAWLAVSAAASFLTATVYALCVACHHSVRLTQLTALALGATLLGLWLGRAHGPVGLAAGLAGANVAMLVPRLWWATRHTPVRLGDFASALAAPLAVSLILAGGLWGGKAICESMGFLPRLIVAGLTGIAAVALATAVWPRLRADYHRLWQHLPLRGRPLDRATAGGDHE